MNDTIRGLIVFLAALFTIALWAPLSGDAEPMPGGGSRNKIYFGLLQYLTVHSELKEPDYKITKVFSPGRLAGTATVSIALWLGIVLFLRKTRPSPGNRTDAQ
jgi:hypothetical protein